MPIYLTFLRTTCNEFVVKGFPFIFVCPSWFKISIMWSILVPSALSSNISCTTFALIGSTLSLYLVDPTMNNLFNDLWFVIVSITTVGYGDVIPNTLYGKMISLILLVIGVFIFSAITGAFSTYFTDNLLFFFKGQCFYPITVLFHKPASI